MAYLKTLVALLLVSCLQLQIINSAPFETTTAPVASTASGSEAGHSSNSTPKPAVPEGTTSAVSGGSTAPAVYTKVDSVTAHAVTGAVPTSGSTAAPVTSNATAEPASSKAAGSSSSSSSNSSTPSASSGSASENRVPPAASGSSPVTPKSEVPSNAATGANSPAPSVTSGSMNSFTIALTNFPAVSKPEAVNPAVPNPCPKECPNGVGGNPPCHCAVPTEKAPSS
ncbi:mucin-21-like isoform X3 [Hyperolius riggenbachi]|uniref:mucin-21-like isoform X3 n=1 Tax=Hyperolius riggenbachi TaxID=752182 RepID=UPI0035A36548